MRSSIFSKWILGHPFQAHVVWPGMVSLAMMGMYFAGIPSLQNLVAPTLERVHSYSWREFGGLEILQNVVLLCICFYLIRCILLSRQMAVRIFLFAFLGMVLFIFAEEIDYGRHFMEFATGRVGSLDPQTWNRNLHNRTLPSGEQLASYIKLAGNLLILGCFVLAPLLLGDSRNRTVRLLAPSKWVMATVAVAIAVSRLAHVLDDAGHGMIDGVEGNLHLNISEFLEFNVYYLFLMYVAVLHERLLHRL